MQPGCKLGMQQLAKHGSSFRFTCGDRDAVSWRGQNQNQLATDPDHHSPALISLPCHHDLFGRSRIFGICFDVIYPH